MTVRAALRIALADFYRQSWRLFVLNGALSVSVVTLVVAGTYAPPTLALLVLVGPLVAALMHCAVTLAQTEELRLENAVTGLRLHWRRGLVLWLLTLGVLAAGATAAVVYGRAGGWAWPLSLLMIYLVTLFGVLQLALWPLAVFERDRNLRGVAADAARAFLRRPIGFLGLAAVLALLNLLGAAAALAPLLTLTVAYSFLAAAHFTLPRNPIREAAADG
jgi:hypothetical protein